MKAKKSILYVLMYLPLVITLIALPYLPDQIPAHYNYSLQVDRWGSKYEVLLLPVASIFVGWILLAFAKYEAKREFSGNNNEKEAIITGIVSLLLFNVLTFYLIYADFKKAETLSSLPIPMNQLLFGIIGIGMIIAGNVIPKLSLNSVIGLRTVWSMKNETTWKKSQHFGGIMFIIAGILTIIVCLLTKGFACFIGTMAIIAVLLVIDIFYTYRIAQKY